MRTIFITIILLVLFINNTFSINSVNKITVIRPGKEDTTYANINDAATNAKVGYSFFVHPGTFLLTTNLLPCDSLIWTFDAGAKIIRNTSGPMFNWSDRRGCFVIGDGFFINQVGEIVSSQDLVSNLYFECNTAISNQKNTFSVLGNNIQTKDIKIIAKNKIHSSNKKAILINSRGVGSITLRAPEISSNTETSINIINSGENIHIYSTIIQGQKRAVDIISFADSSANYSIIIDGTIRGGLKFIPNTATILFVINGNVFGDIELSELIGKHNMTGIAFNGVLSNGIMTVEDAGMNVPLPIGINGGSNNFHFCIKNTVEFVAHGVFYKCDSIPLITLDDDISFMSFYGEVASTYKSNTDNDIVVVDVRKGRLRIFGELYLYGQHNKVVQSGGKIILRGNLLAINSIKGSERRDAAVAMSGGTFELRGGSIEVRDVSTAINKGYGILVKSNSTFLHDGGNIFTSDAPSIFVTKDATLEVKNYNNYFVKRPRVAESGGTIIETIYGGGKEIIDESMR